MMRLLLAILPLLTGAPTGPAECAGWQSVPAGSTLGFEVRYEGTPAEGKFDRFSVCVSPTLDSRRPTRLSVRIDVRSADMDSAELNEAIHAPEWFHSGQYPEATFISGNIERNQDGTLVASGELTLKGIRRPVRVPLEWLPDAEGARLTGAVTVNRTDFDIGTGDWSGDGPIAHAVVVRFSIGLAPAE